MFSQTNSNMRELSSKHAVSYENVMRNICQLDDDQKYRSGQAQTDMKNSLKQQQQIIRALTKVEEKLNRLEMSQTPEIIYQQAVNIPTRKSYESDIQDCKKRLRCRSTDRCTRRNTDRSKTRMSSSAQVPFSQRLHESVDKYYNRIKRDSVERRNVERYVNYS